MITEKKKLMAKSVLGLIVFLSCFGLLISPHVQAQDPSQPKTTTLAPAIVRSATGTRGTPPARATTPRPQPRVQSPRSTPTLPHIRTPESKARPVQGAQPQVRTITVTPDNQRPTRVQASVNATLRQQRGFLQPGQTITREHLQDPQIRNQVMTIVGQAATESAQRSVQRLQASHPGLSVEALTAHARNAVSTRLAVVENWANGGLGAALIEAYPIDSQGRQLTVDVNGTQKPVFVRAVKDFNTGNWNLYMQDVGFLRAVGNSLQIDENTHWRGRVAVASVQDGQIAYQFNSGEAFTLSSIDGSFDRGVIDRDGYVFKTKDSFKNYDSLGGIQIGEKLSVHQGVYSTNTFTLDQAGNDSLHPAWRPGFSSQMHMLIRETIQTGQLPGTDPLQRLLQRSQISETPGIDPIGQLAERTAGGTPGTTPNPLERFMDPLTHPRFERLGNIPGYDLRTLENPLVRGTTRFRMDQLSTIYDLFGSLQDVEFNGGTFKQWVPDENGQTPLLARVIFTRSGGIETEGVASRFADFDLRGWHRQEWRNKWNTEGWKRGMDSVSRLNDMDIVNLMVFTREQVTGDSTGLMVGWGGKKPNEVDAAATTRLARISIPVTGYEARAIARWLFETTPERIERLAE